jgi:hypothetical protein
MKQGHGNKVHTFNLFCLIEKQLKVLHFKKKFEKTEYVRI